MRRIILVFVSVILFQAVSVVSDHESARASASPQAISFPMWSWRQPPYVIVRDSVVGYPYAMPAVVAIALHPEQPDIIYAGTDNSGLCCGIVAPQDGVYKSLNRGQTWEYLTRIDPDQSITQLVVHPISPTIVLAGFRQYFPTKTGGVYRSMDGGQNWDSVLPYVWVHDIEIDPTDPNTIYVSGAPATQPWGIYRSADTGQTWQRISDQWLEDIAVHPITSTILFGARAISTNSVEGIYRSEDSGATWTQVAHLGGQSHILIDQQNPDRMYAYGRTYGDMWKTENAGLSWGMVTTSLPFLIERNTHTIQSAAIDPVDNAIWVGLKYGGVFVSNDGANTWTEFTTGLPFVGVSIFGPQCTGIALALGGEHAAACNGRFYTREIITLDKFVYLPVVLR